MVSCGDMCCYVGMCYVVLCGVVLWCVVVLNGMALCDGYAVCVVYFMWAVMLLLLCCNVGVVLVFVLQCLPLLLCHVLYIIQHTIHTTQDPTKVVRNNAA